METMTGEGGVRHGTTRTRRDVTPAPAGAHRRHGQEIGPSLRGGDERDKADTLPDLRFRALLGPAAWAELPAAVRARFAKRLAPGLAVTYVGHVAECRMRRAGWLLAQLARLIGAPLPLASDTGVPAIVSVTEDGIGGGQVWTRLYGRHRGFPQVIHSAKRFAGATGLEEYLGLGVGIALTVSADAHGIRFTSDHYFVALGQRRLRLPGWLAPGLLTIDHVDRGQGSFAFILALRHRLLGELIHQTGIFHDAAH